VVDGLDDGQEEEDMWGGRGGEVVGAERGGGGEEILRQEKRMWIRGVVVEVGGKGVRKGGMVDSGMGGIIVF